MQYSNCNLCPRTCGADRTKAAGVCGMSDRVALARAALHYWEEPCISGEQGSGAVFFSGCALQCVYCQNRQIATGEVAKEIDAKRLSEIYFELKEKGANNINLVSAAHFLPHIVDSITDAKRQGFDLPFVYNTSGYERVESLRRLEGLVDVYLPDYKYARQSDATKYSKAPDYPTVAISAIDEMVRQQPKAVFRDGIMQRGVIIRHLLLPAKVIESKMAIKRLYDRYGDGVYLSLMSQYTPLPHVAGYPELTRAVTEAEYDSLVNYAVELGVKNAFTQTGESVGESFIPSFDFEGI